MILYHFIFLFIASVLKFRRLSGRNLSNKIWFNFLCYVLNISRSYKWLHSWTYVWNTYSTCLFPTHCLSHRLSLDWYGYLWWRRVGLVIAGVAVYGSTWGSPGAGAAAAPAQAAGLGGGRGRRPAAARQRRQAAHLQHTRASLSRRHPPPRRPPATPRPMPVYTEGTTFTYLMA